MAIELLYFTGMRVGELLALMPSDIEGDVIHITKSLQRMNGKDVVTGPKTPKSVRDVRIPKKIREDLKKYMESCPNHEDTDRIFSFSKALIYRAIAKGCELSGVKRIRIHDLRHSHASLLIELGFSPVLIAERLGHENVQTTLNTYSHLYPTKANELIEKLNELVQE